MYRLMLASTNPNAEGEIRRIAESAGRIAIGTSGCSGITEALIADIPNDDTATQIKRELEAHGYTVTKRAQTQAA
ncbi:MAG: hypothetical protein EBQ80_03230 [Proteobacteria bacterium]|nr:hypothetical protein [Pseudomonadota bacterium]